METKKETRGVKKGTKRGGYNTSEEKSDKVFGYRYTEEEADLIRTVLDEVKKEHKTTSRALLEIFKKYKKSYID